MGSLYLRPPGRIRKGANHAARFVTRKYTFEEHSWATKVGNPQEEEK